MADNQNRMLRSQHKKSKFSLFTSGKVDIVFLSLLLALLVIGLISLFSASYAYSLTNYGDSYHFIKRQALFAVMGLGIMFVTSKIDYHFYRKFAWVIYAAAVVMLIVVLILPPLQEGFDYKRWLKIGSFSFQPSEIAKFAIILLFSHIIANNLKEINDWRLMVILVGLLGLVCGLVVVETHLSATLLIFAIGACLIVIGGLKVRYIVAAVGGGVALGAGAILTGVVGYGGDRIQSWLNPWDYYRTTGWQTIQSLLSIGSGGFLGRGIGESRQKYLWVPEPHNDFIFAIVCEEVGFVGAIAIIAIFIALIWRGFKIAVNAPDKFGSLMAIGLVLQVGLQAALNIMVVTNTIPNTGISLPFFSYGGTALLMLMAQMGIVLNISRQSSVTKS